MDNQEKHSLIPSAGDRQEERTHKRRVRYSGAYPRHFNEKYKEHQPEKYGDTIEKVMKKGSTPAGDRKSVV